MGLFGREKQAARQEALRHIEIMHESIRLTKETVSPDTFFSRYRLAEQKARAAAELCKGEELGFTAEKAQARLLSDKTQAVNDFLLRCAGAGKLPFVKEDILKHRSEMPAQSIKLLESLLETEMQQADTAEYVYCSVEFNAGQKLYYYLAEELPVCAGDLVVVPVGAEGEEKLARVVKVERFEGSQAPVPPRHLKRVIRIVKDDADGEADEKAEAAQLREGLEELNRELRQITADLNRAMEEEEPAAQKKGGLMEAVLAAALLSASSEKNRKKSKKKGRICDGDCENCPPHYGYRYGRWYYGHGHQHGCRRHGNGGRTGRTLRI